MIENCAERIRVENVDAGYLYQKKLILANTAVGHAMLANSGHDNHSEGMIETDWGKPLHIAVTSEGDIQKFSTIEQARYWLRRKWPVDDTARTTALHRIEAAMDCLGSVGAARRAFLVAVKSAGYRPEGLII